MISFLDVKGGSEKFLVSLVDWYKLVFFLLDDGYTRTRRKVRRWIVILITFKHISYIHPIVNRSSLRRGYVKIRINIFCKQVVKVKSEPTVRRRNMIYVLRMHRVLQQVELRHQDLQEHFRQYWIFFLSVEPSHRLYPRQHSFPSSCHCTYSTKNTTTE